VSPLREQPARIFVGWAKTGSRDSSLKFEVNAPLELSMLSMTREKLP
jgi:hypothetical protein